MTKEQQELYEKLLKKVNEFCLGQAAEDVIAAIDALLDTYESRITEADGYATHHSEALRILGYRQVDIYLLKYCFNRNTDHVCYNQNLKMKFSWRELTEKEYELLKEIL